jgi:diacylglycerol kinase family enzyme
MGTLPAMRLALIANDASGSGSTAAGEVAGALRRRGARVEVHRVREVCAPAGDPSALLEAGADRVVVAGGDGSVGGAAELAACLGVPLAVVPTGTANDFARSLDLPLDLDEACALAARERVRTTRVDVARAGDRAFVNAASAGLSVLAARRAHDLKPRLGPLAYAVGALRAGLTARPVRVRVVVDGHEAFSGAAWQVIVAGTGAFGGGAELDAADPADRRLDVAVLAAGPRAALVRRGWAMRAGGLADQDGVLHARGREIEVAGASTFNVDGEVLRLHVATFRTGGESVQIVIP